MTKPPYMPFFGRDFYDDDRVAQMSYHEQGIYLRLLWHQWVNGSLPAAPEDLARITLEPVPERVLACFPIVALGSGKARGKPGESPGKARGKPGVSPGKETEKGTEDDADLHDENTTFRRMNPRLHAERERVMSALAAKRRGGKLGRRKQLEAQAKPGVSPGKARAKPRVSPGKARAKPGHINIKRDIGDIYVEDIPPQSPPIGADGAGEVAVVPVKPVNWSARVIDTWRAVAGEAPVGHLVKALKPVYDEVQDVDRLCYGLAKWLMAGNGRFGPSVFARDWRAWVPGGREHVPRLGELAVEEFVAQVRGEHVD
jgi:hypothetical protein